MISYCVESDCGRISRIIIIDEIERGGRLVAIYHWYPCFEESVFFKDYFKDILPDPILTKIPEITDLVVRGLLSNESIDSLLESNPDVCIREIKKEDSEERDE